MGVEARSAARAFALVVTACTVLATAACDTSAAPPGAASPREPTSSGSLCRDVRPYGGSSVWNLPIGPSPSVLPASGRWVDALEATGQHLSSDVDQYTVGLYCVGADTPRTSVALSGFYSDYTSGVRVGRGFAPTVTGLPVPVGVRPGAGSDGQVVFWDQDAGIEYGFWQFAWSNGRATATNGYAISTGEGSTGRFADGLAGRGAGLPYLAGLVRPEELAAGRVEHALAFAYPYPSSEFVFPASKSDGKGRSRVDLPEGTLLQLDPGLSASDLASMGVTGEGLPVARALQRYGMYVVDNSGSAKVYLQDRISAGWDAGVNRSVLGAIGWGHFRAVAPPRE